MTPHLAGYVNQIYVQAINSTDVQPAIRQITEILVRRHRIKPGADNDFSVRNLSQIAEAAESSSRIMALLLAAVASISLVVGGIGIMNILLVSVTERTREIGLRMAIGARRVHVLLQFLAEAVFLSVTGGAAGILMGVAFVGGDFGHCRLGGADLGLGDCRRVPVFRRGRDFLWLLPGAQSRESRSDRGAQIRVINSSFRGAGETREPGNQGQRRKLLLFALHSGPAPSARPGMTGWSYAPGSIRCSTPSRRTK